MQQRKLIEIKRINFPLSYLQWHSPTLPFTFLLCRGRGWNNRSSWFAYKWRVHTKIRMQAETCYRESIIRFLVRALNKLFQSMESASFFRSTCFWHPIHQLRMAGEFVRWFFRVDRRWRRAEDRLMKMSVNKWKYRQCLTAE